MGAEIFGVSLEGVEKHKAFAESLKLNFPLVADEKQSVAAGFGAQRLWGSCRSPSA